MSLAKASSSAPPSAIKSDDENPFDIFIRQALGKDNSSVHWVQLVHPFDQPDLPGWPLLTPLKIQSQKCEKCPREFCSPMNYRRHIRTHRRSLNIDKESHKNRDLLGAFWDKLSLDEARRVVSFDDISLEGISGSLIVNAWESYLFKPIVLSLPQAYLKDGTILLEIIQAKSSRLPISSQELFSILDETSERTFLCAGTAESVQKFIIDGGVEKALELRNLVASISLLFEQKLVKAWLADKDAEALRCQKILVEEEEVAQKRQTQKSERKRLKKLRQKEPKARGRLYGEKTDSNAGEKTDSNSLDSNADFVEGQASAEISIPQFPFDNCCDTLTDLKPCLEQIDFSGKENEEFVELVGSPREWSTDDLYQSTISTWQVPKHYRRRRVGLYGGQNPSTAKHEALRKQSPAKEMTDVRNGVKVWPRKSNVTVNEESSGTTVQIEVVKIAIDEESSRTSGQNVVAESEIDVESSKTILLNVVSKFEIDVERSGTSSQNIVASHMDMSNCKLLIGSISVPVTNSTAEQHVSRGALTDSSEKCATPEKLNNSQESDPILKAQDPTIAMSKDVCVYEVRSDLPVPMANQNCGENARLGKVEDQSATFLQSSVSKPNGSISNIKNSYSKRNVQPEGSVLSSFDAKTFLEQRWKDVLASDHVKLVLSPEPSVVADDRKDCPSLDQTSDSYAETPVADVEPHVSFIKENSKAKFKKKTKKGATRTK